jgi:hypothetical protein
MKRAVRDLLRLIAAGLCVFGGLEIGLAWLRHRVQKTGISPWHCVLGSILVALGVALFAASARLAGHLTDDFDE